MAEAISLVELVMDVHDRLDAGGVGHGFGGALALAYYVAEPRATRDMDLNVFASVEEAVRIFSLLPEGIAWDEADVERCRSDGQVRLWHGQRPSGIPVDLFFPQHEFHRAVAEATSPRPFARLDYLLPVIAAAHLVVFKALFDRAKDWVDIATMLDAGMVDVEEALGWLVVLLGADDPRCRRLVDSMAERRAGGAAGRRGAPAPAGHLGPLPVVDWDVLGGS